MTREIPQTIAGYLGKALALLAITIINTNIYAQVIEPTTIKEIIQYEPVYIGHKTVVVHQDARLTNFMHVHTKMHQRDQTLPGWRVQLYFGTGYGAKESAEEVENNFIENYPEVPSYLVYHPPYFKVYVGNFRQKRDAHKFMKDIKTVYPGAWTVRDMIEFPDLTID